MSHCEKGSCPEMGTQRYTKAVLARAAICSLSGSHVSRSNPRLLTGSVWGSATPFRSKVGKTLSLEGPNTHCLARVETVHPIQSPVASRNWDRSSMASLKESAVEI